MEGDWDHWDLGGRGLRRGLNRGRQSALDRPDRPAAGTVAHLSRLEKDRMDWPKYEILFSPSGQYYMPAILLNHVKSEIVHSVFL